ncbi:hypothetical protein V8E36_006249 [Tilletia maclaganii]
MLMDFVTPLHSAEPASTSSTSAERQGTFVQQIATCLFPCCASGTGASGSGSSQPRLADGQPRPFSGLLDRWTRAVTGSSLFSRAPLSSARDDDERTPLLRAAGQRSGTGSNDLLSSDQDAAGLGPRNGWSERGGDGSGGLGSSAERADGLDAQPEAQQRRATIAPSPELLRKITESTQQNFLNISPSGPYMPEELDRRSATSGGGIGLDRRSITSGGGRLSNDLRGSGLDRRSAGSLTQQQQQYHHHQHTHSPHQYQHMQQAQSNPTIIPATPGSVEPGAPGGPGSRTAPPVTPLTVLTALPSRPDTKAAEGSDAKSAAGPSNSQLLERSILAKLEAESILSGPIVEGWPED